MHIFKQVEPWRAYLKRLRSEGVSIGLVPTMGALHSGHLSLIGRCKNENKVTVCSIYVNPAQFTNPVDLKNYPRTLEKDFELLESLSCDVAFCPDNQEMYPEERNIAFDFGSLDKVLEGKFRPGHFSGVALVVAKLFNIIEPDRAYFGLKDFQQFKIISKLVRELKFNLQVVGVPIVREPDGLAMSSRNSLLNPDERRRAVALHECLTQIRKGLMQGKDFSSLKDQAVQLCGEKNVKVDYLALADKDDLSLRDQSSNAQREVLLIAGYVGSVRLIDNLFLTEN